MQACALLKKEAEIIPDEPLTFQYKKGHKLLNVQSLELRHIPNTAKQYFQNMWFISLLAIGLIAKNTLSRSFGQLAS